MLFQPIRSMFADTWFVGKIEDHQAKSLTHDEVHSACAILNAKHPDVMGTELRAAIDRSGLDISLCRICGKVVICIPDGLSNICEPCAARENRDPTIAEDGGRLG
jgi:hypothetical protein